MLEDYGPEATDDWPLPAAVTQPTLATCNCVCHVDVRSFNHYCCDSVNVLRAPAPIYVPAYNEPIADEDITVALAIAADEAAEAAANKVIREGMESLRADVNKPDYRGNSMHLIDEESRIITAAGNLIFKQWGNGRTTAGASADLDWAQDEMRESLDAWFIARLQWIVDNIR